MFHNEQHAPSPAAEISARLKLSPLSKPAHRAGKLRPRNARGARETGDSAPQPCAKKKHGGRGNEAPSPASRARCLARGCARRSRAVPLRLAPRSPRWTDRPFGKGFIHRYGRSLRLGSDRPVRRSHHPARDPRQARRNSVAWAALRVLRERREATASADRRFTGCRPLKESVSSSGSPLEHAPLETGRRYIGIYSWRNWGRFNYL